MRLSGEDSRRGTFSQRHAALVDYENEHVWIPLQSVPGAQAPFWVYDSLLSEYAALGFEYGYAHVNKRALVMWEAQFGDFINGAQIIIDQYLVAAEDKWGQTNGLVLLLPHGFEGQGPEHSSARIERFLTLCAEDNIQVCNATTAAQYFHLLRRQVRRDVRKPLILFTPKAPLRMKESRSPIDDLTHGSFEEVLDDPFVTDPAAVSRLVFCSGKVAWDAIARARQAPGAGGRHPPRAAVPVPPGAAARGARALPERPRAGVAAGGAGEHGAVELRRGPHVADQGARLRPAPRRPGGERQPGDGQQGRSTTRSWPI